MLSWALRALGVTLTLGACGEGATLSGWGVGCGAGCCGLGIECFPTPFPLPLLPPFLPGAKIKKEK